MAARSLLFRLRSKGSGRNDAFSSFLLLSHTNSEVLVPLKSFSSEALSTEALDDSTSSSDDLKSRLFRLRLPKRSATNVLQNWVNEGNQISISDLRHVSKELRKSRRYKHALEISEWMVSHGGFKLSDTDYAVRIDLMTKVFGIDAAERYFEALPQDAKTTETYTSLLHSYAGAKLTDKAEVLYERIKDSGLTFNVITYNEMMTLYMSVGQVEKVPSVVEELKRQKITPDLFTYNLWISSCAATLNIDGVRSILDEMIQDPSSNEDWARYRNLVDIYVKAGQLENSGPHSLVVADGGISQREWISYDFLIMLHAGLGKKDMIDQIWKSLRMTGKKMTSRNYVCVLSSYLLLGHMREVEEVVDQWRQYSLSIFDRSICDKVISSLVEAGLGETAEMFHSFLRQKELESSPS